MISENGEERMCDEKISASVGITAKTHAHTRTSNLRKHSGPPHPEISKPVQEKVSALSGRPTASNTKALCTGKKPATAILTKFFDSDKVIITMTPDALKKVVDIAVLSGISLRFFSQPEAEPSPASSQ